MRILLFSLALLLAYVPAGFAQTLKVTGTVTDAAGRPLVGVNVVVKGTTIGTTTMTDGKYELNFPPPAARELVFTYIGMVTQEVAVHGRTTVNITMREDTNLMDEVVVVGYGTQKKIHMTGSVAAVSGDEIVKTPVSSITQALVGKLPGIVTQQASGAPGSDAVTINVRGYSSFKGGGPLYIVDGIERPMGLIDPNDVESITVLKDAASSAVYGMRAANGVVLITTKKGQKGSAVVNYRGSVTLSRLTTLPDFMNGTQYMEYYNKGLELDGLKPYFTQEEIDMTHNGDLSDGLENTDWTTPLYRTTLMHQHNVSVSGGTDRVNYYVSGGFMNQEGIMKGNENQRANFRSNVDATPFKNLRVSLNVAGTVQDLNVPGGRSYKNQEGFNIFHLMMYSLPFVPKEIDIDGVTYPTSAYRNRNAANAEYESANTGFNKSRNLRLETMANVEYSFPFLKGLKAGMSVGWDWKYGTGKNFTYGTELMAYGFSRYESEAQRVEPLKRYVLTPSVGLTADGNMFTSKTEEQQIVLRPQISYANKFGKHDVSALFLYEQTTFRQDVLIGTRRSFDLFDLPELRFGSSATATNDGYLNKRAYAGYVGRLNYAYDDKYLVELSARYDGSYLFHKDHRWGFFPSMSLGWVMSQEDFFASALPKIEFFKLRASYGVLGSDNVDPFLYRKSYLYVANSVAFGNSPVSGGVLSNVTSYPMEELTWERSRTINGGFELSAWNGLLGVEFDYFYKYTFDILQNLGDSSVYPPSLGGHTPSAMNTGAFDNRGFELVLKHRNRIGKFNYSIAGNLTYAHNRILSQIQATGTQPWQNTLGTPYGAIWGYKSAGLFQTQEEIDNSPILTNVTPRVGDIKYVDTNGDGQITEQDRVQIGRGRMPEMMYALTLNADWKGFDISVQLQGAARTDLFLQEMWYRGMNNTNPVADMTPLTQPFYANYDNSPLYLMENSWRPDNPNAEYPRLSVDKSSALNNAVVSDFWKRNGAYLRLKNVTLGYTFPRRWTNRIGISSLRVYASGYNLLTATEFKYLDPESTNVATGYYPQQRTFSFGVDVSF